MTIDPLKVKRCENEIINSVRLFTFKDLMDSITVSHRLLDDPGLLFDCFRLFSNGHCFCAKQTLAECRNSYTTKILTKKAPKKGGKDKEGSSELEQYTKLFPSWFNPNKGGTIFQWVTAFLEQLLICRFFELRGANQVPFEDVVGPYRQIMISHKKTQDFWKSLPQRAKIKVINEFELAASKFSPPDRVGTFKTVSISCQILQKSQTAEALSAKEFLCYACYYANPYILLDSLSFVKFSIASIFLMKHAI